MALQVCTSQHLTQLRLETPRNAGDQSRISLLFAESPSQGEGKSLQHAALERSLPQQPAQLGAPAHICVPSCQRRVAAREAQPQPAASTGTPRAARGAGSEGAWQEKPHCWGRERLLAREELGSHSHWGQYGTNGWRAEPRCSVQPQLRAPWTLPSWKGPKGSNSALHRTPPE